MYAWAWLNLLVVGQYAWKKNNIVVELSTFLQLFSWALVLISWCLRDVWYSLERNLAVSLGWDADIVFIVIFKLIVATVYGYVPLWGVWFSSSVVWDIV